MSSILKALKKLEKEKARRQSGEINLSREILHEAPRRKARFSWPWVAAVATIALLLTLVTVLLERGPRQTQPAPQAAQPLPAPTPPPAAPLPAAALQPRATAAVPAGKVVIQQAAPAATQPAAGLPVPLPAAAPPDNRPSLPQSAPPVIAYPARVEQTRKQSPSAEPSEAAFAVSGIAWNKDSADRLAIVNGQPLTTGSAIGDALVEEILPDRVRLSRGGKTFEVHLGKAGKTH